MTQKSLVTIVLASIILMGADATTPKQPATPVKHRSANRAQSKNRSTPQRHVSRRQQQISESNSQVWNLKDVDLRTVAHEISKATGKNFIIGPKVDDKVSFITSYRLPKDELYQAFVALLHAYGYAAVPEGDVIKIVPDSSKNQLRPHIGAMSNGKAQIELRTIRVNNYPANDLVKIIKPLIPRYSYVAAYKPSNDLIIVDHAAHIGKIIDLVHRLDKSNSKAFEVVKLHYSTAEELAKTLQDLLGAQGRGQTTKISQVRIVAEPRSNALIISNAPNHRVKEIRSLIARLDVPDDAANERTEVIYLKYMPAETFAPIIQGLIESYIAQEEAKTGKAVARRQLQTGTTTRSGGENRASLNGQFNLQNPLSNFGGSSGGSSNINTGGSVGTYEAEAPKSGILGNHVQWEASTNSVIITAPAAVIRRVRSVVGKLDIRRPQVLIEVVVAEIDVDRVQELGIEWGDFTGKTQVNTRFAPILPLSGIGQNGNYSTQGVADTIGQGLTVGVFHGMNLHLLVRALGSDSDSNILATPNLVTLDNEPALIKVGRKVSFTIGQIENNPTGGNPFNSFEREDVGLILSIRPQITPDGEIRLNITQELSSVINGTEQTRAGSNPDTTERFIQTTVMADNDQILVLGGLLQKEFQQVVDKIPIIGDIPVLGLMFRNHYKQMRKTNLMIFLHPVIMFGPKDAAQLSNGKYEYLRAAQMHLDKYKHRIRVNPVAPILHKPVSLPDPFCDKKVPCWGHSIHRGYSIAPHNHTRFNPERS